jgi:glucose/arabinose dehydrogenase
MKRLFVFFLLFLLTSQLHAAPLLRGESEGMPFQLEEVATGLGIPWGMVMLDRGQLLITEREGRIQRLDLNSGELTKISGLPELTSSGQGGLLDVASEGPYQPGNWLYFTYSQGPRRQMTTVLARAKLQANRMVDWQELLVTKAVSSTGRHFGSRIVFDGQGHLFFSVGDRGERPNGQDLKTHAGSIIRLKLDGTVPDDNPFVGRNDALAEIWSYGHRNPQGLAYDRDKQQLWAIEHGPRGGDEINLIRRGENYGWATVSHGKEYWGPLAVGEATSMPGMVDPIKVYTPSIAPGSLLLYSGDAFPKWRGNLLSGALKLQHLNRVVFDSAGQAVKEERLLQDLAERIRAVLQSPEGWIYLSTDSGRILRLRPGD